MKLPFHSSVLNCITKHYVCSYEAMASLHVFSLAFDRFDGERTNGKLTKKCKKSRLAAAAAAASDEKAFFPSSQLQSI